MAPELRRLTEEERRDDEETTEAVRKIVDAAITIGIERVGAPDSPSFLAALEFGLRRRYIACQTQPQKTTRRGRPYLPIAANRPEKDVRKRGDAIRSVGAASITALA